MNKIIIFLIFIFLASCGGGGEYDASGYSSTATPAPTPTIVNQPPTLMLQSVYDVDAGNIVELSASASDSDGQVNSIEWEVVSGPASTTLLQDSGEQISVDVPSYYCGVTVTIRVTATDNQNATANADTTIQVSPLPRLSAEEGTSYSVELCAPYIDRIALRTENPENFAQALTYADFNNDGITDIFVASGNSMTRTPFEMYIGDDSQQYQYTQTLFSDPTLGQIHPRRAITSDFNSDGQPDVFVLGHGVDASPFPGEYNILLVSSGNQLSPGQDLATFVGFNHGGAAADIDLDTDMDIVVATGKNSYFLLNDGTGFFTYNQTDIPMEMIVLPAFSAELLDLDMDGFVDLLAGGHEFTPDDMPTIVYWGDGTSDYSIAESTMIPAVPNYQVVLDFDAGDLDGNGLRELIVTRAGGGTDAVNFYKGYAVQYLETQTDRTFLDKSSAIADSVSATEDWFSSIRLTDIDFDADLDVVVDDASRQLIWLNDGQGNLAH